MKIKELLAKVWRRGLKFFANKQYLRYMPAPPVEVLASEWPEYFNNGCNKKKVLYIAAKYDYGDRSRGISYEEYNFLYTLKNMEDIELIRLDVYSLCHRYGKDTTNKVIKEVALLNGVDKILVLLYHDIFKHEMFLELSKSKTFETILWLFDDDKRYKSTKGLVRCFNKVVTTIPFRHEQRLKKGINSQLAQFAANHFLYKDYSIERDVDVVFIGQNFGHRQEYIEYLKENDINVLVYGRGWPNSRRLTQVEMIELLNRAKVALNFSSSDGNPNLRFLKGRVFEIPATGALLLTEECEDLDKYFDIDKEVITFHDKETLLNKIKNIISDPRLVKSISETGQLKVIENYTFERYIREVL
ncbi:glycosyltransferase [Hahella ganghwensis]|uniref:glycosyltransferase family protein n=1 Tax=Hahella ganghwensis TaxID=286420 RepID=UPI00036134DC|nr:glycosyltransferase [Hahella ganghwensis]